MEGAGDAGLGIEEFEFFPAMAASNPGDARPDEIFLETMGGVAICALYNHEFSCDDRLGEFPFSAPGRRRQMMKKGLCSLHTPLIEYGGLMGQVRELYAIHADQSQEINIFRVFGRGSWRNPWPDGYGFRGFRSFVRPSCREKPAPKRAG